MPKNKKWRYPRRPLSTGIFTLRLSIHGGPVAYCRAWVYSCVFRWWGELCQDCGRPYWPVVYMVPDEVWAAVAAAPGRSVHPRPVCLLCPTCLTKRADRAGLSLTWTAAA